MAVASIPKRVLMKRIFTLITSILYSVSSFSQFCPGAGTDFSTADFFDLSWIYLCNTGTSCTGGTSFDNRLACEPTTAIDACAPAPTCGTVSNTGSDLWFKFYANTPTAVIKVIQNVSFVASIQAFSAPGHNPSCSELTQIGCVVANGPSSGVTLNLTSLIPGNLYFFRVYGTHNAPSQRTGTFCFCGSSGLTPITLPVKLNTFTASPAGHTALLKWTADCPRNFGYFQIEKSYDGINFTAIGKQSAVYNSSTNYHFEDISGNTGKAYYRLKLVYVDEKYEYSDVVDAGDKALSVKFAAIADNVNKRIIIYSQTNTEVDIYSSTGIKLATYRIEKGSNNFNNIKPGTYIIRKKDTGEVQKLLMFPQ